MMDYNQILFGQGGGQQPGPVAQAPAMPPAQAPIQQAAPTPEQIEAQDSSGFLQKVQTDPAFTQAMLMMGSRLLQGPRPGQDDAGMLGDAAMVGLTAHNMMKGNEHTQALQDQEMALREKKAKVDMASTEARTAGTLQDTEQKGLAFPETQKRIAEEIKALRTRGRLQEAQALMTEFKADPARLAEDRGLDMQKTRAEIGATGARASASMAAAGASTARAEQIRDETANPSKYFRPTAGGKEKDWQAAFAKWSTDNGYNLNKPKELAEAKAAFQLTVDQGEQLSGRGTGAGASAPPAGMELVGTSGGRPVYRDAQGNQFLGK